MIPDSGEPIQSDVPAGAAFWTPDPGELEERDSIGYFRDVWLLGHVERHEAAAVARDEHELVRMADSFAGDHEEFERILLAFDYSDADFIPAKG
ncbi:hypothetical protein [Streptomyces manipurensis]|uniref:hypothetical protein n=1 Tax=Streptomyces manipurensis TaxID=1077945 RepID=UPI003C6F9161